MFLKQNMFSPMKIFQKYILVRILSLVHRYPHWLETQVIARENRMIGTNSSSFMTEDESSINGRDPSLKHRWKSVDKLCGFREPFSLEHKVHPCDRDTVSTVGKSGCIRSRVVIKPPRRIAYTAKIIDYPALISGQVGHFENQMVTSLSLSLRHSLVYSFAILLRLSEASRVRFLTLRNLMKNKHIFSPGRTIASRCPTPAVKSILQLIPKEIYLHGKSKFETWLPTQRKIDCWKL